MKTMEKEVQIKNFVPLPREIRDDYTNGILTPRELFVLLWIWVNANPVNGFYSMSYEGLRQDLRKSISYDNARQIISSLRKKQYIYFQDHRGRKGSFPVYPIGFRLSNKTLITLDRLKKKSLLSNQSQLQEQMDAQSKHNFNDRYHNLNNQRNSLVKRLSINEQTNEITTTYNDNKNDNKNIVGKKSYIHRNISVFSFMPKTYEEQQCWEIAKILKETDMRFILSCLKKYGFNHIEKKWAIFKEIPKGHIKDPRKYFNKVLRDNKG